MQPAMPFVTEPTAGMIALTDPANPNPATFAPFFPSSATPTTPAPPAPAPPAPAPNLSPPPTLTHALNRLDIDNAYLLQQNATLTKELAHSRYTIQALRHIINQKDQAVLRAANDLRRASWKIRVLEAVLVRNNAQAMAAQFDRDSDGSIAVNEPGTAAGGDENDEARRHQHFLQVQQARQDQARAQAHAQAMAMEEHFRQQLLAARPTRMAAATGIESVPILGTPQQGQPIGQVGGNVEGGGMAMSVNGTAPGLSGAAATEQLGLVGSDGGGGGGGGGGGSGVVGWRKENDDERWDYADDDDREDDLEEEEEDDMDDDLEEDEEEEGSTGGNGQEDSEVEPEVSPREIILDSQFDIQIPTQPATDGTAHSENVDMHRHITGSILLSNPENGLLHHRRQTAAPSPLSTSNDPIPSPLPTPSLSTTSTIPGSPGSLSSGLPTPSSARPPSPPLPLPSPSPSNSTGSIVPRAGSPKSLRRRPGVEDLSGRKTPPNLRSQPPPPQPHQQGHSPPDSPRDDRRATLKPSRPPSPNESLGSSFRSSMRSSFRRNSDTPRSSRAGTDVDSERDLKLGEDSRTERNRLRGLQPLWRAVRGFTKFPNVESGNRRAQAGM